MKKHLFSLAVVAYKPLSNNAFNYVFEIQPPKSGDFGKRGLALDVSEFIAHTSASFMAGTTTASSILKNYIGGFTLWLGLITR
ncbi:hypothetical protein [Chryseobacterium pennipullorum]|uniref:Uncharacterized protein n=1 Tax=Chryseobacterium pennipullorum TaxID=2258963 RepID=A0A3D9B9R7_9FLAO|nr:hypothetical protein [Chryseobacterium pennipullorum]REC50333.1 hypothetical protein DRF67_02045 [Chryseobacterium pennipullorum]